MASRLPAGLTRSMNISGTMQIITLVKVT